LGTFLIKNIIDCWIKRDEIFFFLKIVARVTRKWIKTKRKTKMHSTRVCFCL